MLRSVKEPGRGAGRDILRSLSLSSRLETSCDVEVFSSTCYSMLGKNVHAQSAIIVEAMPQ